jgi:pimeloyl-ACP methyl ester carboxylesterase
LTTFVLIHGAWADARSMRQVAAVLETAGHVVHTPTMYGNRPGDPKTIGLEPVIQSIVDYFVKEDLKDVVLLGHSFAGIIITAVADRLPHAIRRLVYWNALVANNGESAFDLCPPELVQIFESLAPEGSDGGMTMPFVVWRETLINDVDIETAKATYELLNPQPIKTFRDKLSLKLNPAQMNIAKSYINCTDDAALPPHYGWHPRLSMKLGLYRLVQVPGSHELCFSDPVRLAGAIMDAGRD